MDLESKTFGPWDDFRFLLMLTTHPHRDRMLKLKVLIAVTFADPLTLPIAVGGIITPLDPHTRPYRTTFVLSKLGQCRESRRKWI